MGDDPRDPRDDDAAIFAAVRAEERERAFRLLQAAYARRIFNLAMYLVRDHHLAEDVMQETLFQIYKDLDDVREVANLRAWVLTVTNHRAIDAIRKRARQQGRIVDLEHAPEVFDPKDLPPEMAGFAQDVKSLQACLAELPVKTQHAVLMRFHQGLSFEDMAKGLDEKADSVRMRVVRAMKKLRKCLDRKGGK